MKRSLLILASLSVLLAAGLMSSCGKKDPQPAPEQDTTSAPADVTPTTAADVTPVDAPDAVSPSQDVTP